MRLQSVASNHPVKSVFGLTVAWLLLLMTFAGISATALNQTYGDPFSVSLAHLAVLACVVSLLWKLSWLRSSGILGAGSWPVWIVSLAGLVYFLGCSLYAFYGMAGLQFSMILSSPGSGLVAFRMIPQVISEEIMFRGLVLSILVRAWTQKKLGLLKSVLLTSTLFSLLHLTQAVSGRLDLTSLLYLLAETLNISIWWAALVIWGRSVWPAVVLHYAVNAIVVMTGLSVPMVGPASIAYRQLLWFSLPLGIAGIWLLLKCSHLSIAPTEDRFGEK